MICVAGTLMVLDWIGVLDSLPSEIMGFITITLSYFVSFLKDRFKAPALFSVLLIIATPATLYASLFSRIEVISFVIVFLFSPVISIVGLNLEISQVFLNCLISKLSLWFYIFQEIPRSLCVLYDLSHMRGFHITLIVVLFCTVLHPADYYDKKYKAAILNG